MQGGSGDKTKTLVVKLLSVLSVHNHYNIIIALSLQNSWPRIPNEGPIQVFSNPLYKIIHIHNKLANITVTII